MTAIDELLQRLRSRREMIDRGNGNVTDEPDADCYEAADKIEELVRATQWRPIESLPPDHVGPVWIGNNVHKMMTVAEPDRMLARVGRVWRLHWGRQQIVQWSPTHWMPIPKPPPRTA